MDPSRGSRGLVSRPPAAARNPNSPRGSTNGVRGRTNGLVESRGRTNGLVHGIGFTNGVRLRQSKYGIVAPADYRRVGAFIAACVLVMVVLGYFFGTPEPYRSPFAVDGNFSEWGSVPTYTDPVEALPASADLVAFKVHAEPGRLFVYGKTAGPMFPGTGVSSLYLLIDDPSRRGYTVQDRDVDFLAEIWGWGGQVRGTVVRQWTGDPDRDNATAFRSSGAFEAASAGSEVELMLTDNQVGLDSVPGWRFAPAVRLGDDLDIGATVGRPLGALVVEELALTSSIASPTPVLELHLQALGGSVEVRSFLFNHTGGGTILTPALPFVVAAGQPPRVVQITLDPSGLPAGSFVSLRLLDVDVVAAGSSDTVPATITGGGARLYVGPTPSGYVIDGLFAEWTSPVLDPADPLPASIDLRETAFAVPADAFFYVHTAGSILAGAILPEQRTIPVAAGNGTPPAPQPPRRNAAEDVLDIYVDTDDRDSVGMAVGGIVANRFLEVRGRNGRVLSSTLYAWNDVTWRWDPSVGRFDVALVGSELEASADAAFFGPMSGPRAVFAMTDWSRRADLTDIPAPASAPILKTQVSPFHSSLPDEINVTSLVNTPVIDGVCGTSPGEYLGASVASNPSLIFAIGRRDDTQFVYICIHVTLDTTKSPNDWGEVIFDTMHDGGGAPQTDDRLLYVFGNGDTTVKKWQGNGTGWDLTCGSCDSGDAGASRYAGGVESYEFKVRYTDVWSTLTPSSGQTAGFAIIAYDFNLRVLHTWGGPTVDENIPDTWGHAFYPIPEFPIVALGVLPAVVIPLLRRRRRRIAR